MKSRTLFIVAVLLVCAAFPVIAQEQRAMVLDDLFNFKRVGAPALSPDGAWVAVPVTEINMDENRGYTDIWLLPMDGGEAVRLTTDPAGDNEPAWSPDGKTLAFTRKGQIWLLPLSGGEPRKLTDIPSGAGGPVWSPDGTKMLFTSFVWPNCDEECAKEREQREKQSKVTAKTATELLYRHWDTWRTDGKRSHLFIIDVATGEYRDLIPDADYDVPPFPFGGSSDYTFSPDGAEVCFTAKVAPDPAWNTNLDLLTVPAAGGTPVNITQEHAGEDFGPTYSADGKYLAYGYMERARFEADQVEIVLLDRATGERRILTGDFDRNIAEYAWLPDGSGFVVTADNHGQRPIFRVPMDGATPTEVAGDGYITSLNLSTDGSTLVYTYRSLDTPPCIYTAPAAGGEAAQLSHFNDEQLAGIKFGAVENHWFDGANGDKVQIWLVKPPTFEEGTKYPLLHIIHGGPQQNYADLWTNGWNSQFFAAKGYVVALVCFHATPGYGQDFTDAVTHNWGGAPYEDIMKATDFLIGLGYIDEDRMAAGGGSYGGYMVDWIATQTNRFKALVSHAGVYNLVSMYGVTEELWFPEWELGGPFFEDMTLYKKWSPHYYVQNARTPMLISHGQQDFRVPVSQGMELFTALRRQGVPAKLIYFPDENHWILQHHNQKFWYEEFAAWLEKYLGPNE